MAKNNIKDDFSIGMPKIIWGYVIYDKHDKIYIDENDYGDKVENACVYGLFNEAKDWIEESDEPNNYEIHKIKYIYNIENIYERNVIYDVVYGEVEE